MADNKPSLSWVKYLIVAAIVCAAALLLLQDKPEGSNESSGDLAENLTRFYEKFSITSSDPIKQRYGDSVIQLEAAKASQTEQLVAIRSVEQAPAENWSGEFKFRSFAQGTTIRTEAMKYAEQEGMQLIWDLNKDFVIKHRFLSENNLLASLSDVASAIDSSFVPEVNVYFCNKKRTIVISAEAGTYVKNNCTKAEFD